MIRKWALIVGIVALAVVLGGSQIGRSKCDEIAGLPELGRLIAESKAPMPAIIKMSGSKSSWLLASPYAITESWLADQPIDRDQWADLVIASSAVENVMVVELKGECVAAIMHLDTRYELADSILIALPGNAVLLESVDGLRPIRVSVISKLSR